MLSVVHGYGPTCWKKIPQATRDEVVKNVEYHEDKVYMSVKQ
jgi:hypothetical protein